jgi:opacity protein-like surface antigen
MPSDTRSQSISFGIGAGVLAVQSPDFYTRATSPPGLYKINGDFSYSNGLDFHSEFQLRGVVDGYFEGANLGVSLEFLYSFLRGKGQSYFIVGDYVQPKNLTTKLDLWSLGLAGRYYPFRAVCSPFASVAGRWNSFGELRFQYEDRGYRSEANATKGCNRFCFGLGAGCDVATVPQMLVRVECQYSWNNLAGHKEGEEQFGSIDTSITILYTLAN